jgi:glycosyltransferase involved in cell wall biosynthesis
MTGYPLVSIVTPTFRHGHYLPYTIESILSQSYPHIEYMIYDAGSQDATPQILEQYRAQGVQSEVIEGIGQSAAINRGWKQSKGEIVAWLNSDDTYFDDTVQQAVDYFMNNPDAAWLYGEVVFIDEDRNPFAFRDPVEEWSYERLLQRNFITQPSVFLRRKVLEDMGYLRNDLDFMMDYEYWLRIGQAYAGHYVPEVRSTMMYHRSTKSAAGGFTRLEEMEAVVRRYGGDGLPHHARYEWIMYGWDGFFGNLREGKGAAALDDLRQTVRYPGAIPLGTAKYLVNKLLPRSVEKKLRQMLIR